MDGNLHYFTKIIMMIVWGGILFSWGYVGTRRLQRHGKAGSLIVLTLFLCWQAYCSAIRLQPRFHYTTNLTQLVQHVHPSHYHIRQFTKEQHLYFAVTGSWSLFANLHRMITFRSGPPGYIYDHHGQLVEWTQDVWEAPIEWSEWSEASRRGYVCSFEQVLTLMDQEMNLFNKRLLSSYVEEG